MSDLPESWDYLEVAYVTWVDDDFSAASRNVYVHGDWTYPQDRFDAASLVEMLSWLGKAGWELVSTTQITYRDGASRHEDTTAFMRRPTRFASSP